MFDPSRPSFNKAQHIKYWLRCMKTHLPTQYTSNDSQRTTLAFFILSALDLLGVLHERTSEAERTAFIDWIYRCQHPDGGFRGFTGTDMGEARNAENSCWDPANVAATFFSLAALTVLRDGLQRVRRRECLKWIKALQLADGSFGEALGEGGKVEGGRDVRFCYCAAAVRWMLRLGSHDEEADVADIDVEALVAFITSSQTYEGGIGKAPFHEAHAGCTYCGIATLSLLGHLPRTRGNERASTAGRTEITSEFLDAVTRWLVYRQTSLTQTEGFPVHVNAFPSPILNQRTPSHHALTEDAKMDLESISHVQGSSLQRPENSPIPPIILQSPAPPPPDPPVNELLFAGFNGRCNKVCDTCYSFWVGGNLAILQKVHLFNFTANRQYLLSRSQHLIGGFGKLPGDIPDILHSYLGLAALAAMREAELRSIDPMLCMSVSAREGLESTAVAAATANGKAHEEGIE